MIVIQNKAYSYKVILYGQSAAKEYIHFRHDDTILNADISAEYITFKKQPFGQYFGRELAIDNLTLSGDSKITITGYYTIPAEFFRHDVIDRLGSTLGELIRAYARLKVGIPFDEWVRYIPTLQCGSDAVGQALVHLDSGEMAFVWIKDRKIHWTLIGEGVWFIRDNTLSSFAQVSERMLEASRKQLADDQAFVETFDPNEWELDRTLSRSRLLKFAPSTNQR